jgi:accessory gene regulator B
MRFIHVWSYVCANFLMNQLKENHEKRRVYYYGFQIVIGAIVKGILLIGTSLILGTLLPTLFLLLIFGSLRMLAGGYHMDTYGKCIITSLAMFVFFGFAARYTFTYWNIAHMIILIVISLIIGLRGVIKWAPSDTPNKPITNPDEIRRFKKLSVIFCIIWLILLSVTVFLRAKSIIPVEVNMYILAGSFGFLLEIFTIYPVGNRFFDMISGKFNNIKVSKKAI